MERIADVLEKKYPQFNTAVSDCLVSDALYQMCCENVDFLIVMENERFQGIITDHDIASKVLMEERPLNKIRIKEFMSRTLPVATPAETLEQCMLLMERYQVKHLAIFDQFDFRGVVSASDLMHEALSERSTAFDDAAHRRQGYPWNY